MKDGKTVAARRTAAKLATQERRIFDETALEDIGAMREWCGEELGSDLERFDLVLAVSWRSRLGDEYSHVVERRLIVPRGTIGAAALALEKVGDFFAARRGSPGVLPAFVEGTPSESGSPASGTRPTSQCGTTANGRTVQRNGRHRKAGKRAGAR